MSIIILCVYQTFTLQNNTCRFKSTLSKARVTGWTEMGPPRTEESLKHMVAGESNGPVAVRIDGSHSSFQHYKGGNVPYHINSRYVLGVAILCL